MRKNLSILIFAFVFLFFIQAAVAHFIGTGKKYYAAIILGILAIITGIIAFLSKGKK